MPDLKRRHTPMGAIATSAIALIVNASLTAETSAELRFEDVSGSALPDGVTAGRSMDVECADVNADGRPDLIIASEIGPNLVLLNAGGIRFTHDPAALPGNARHDSEDIAVADFDGDGDFDLVFISEDTYVNECYLNRGDGSFENASDRIGATGVSKRW
ncbi:MAG: FG-GAP-like repeat-containing protein, partial [Planctomycetota bacterium]